MTCFGRLVVRVEALRSICVENLNKPEILEISVDQPAPPLDELFFRKAVAWFYVLFQETGPFISFSGKLLRARSDPDAYEKLQRAKEIVQFARTVHAHNILPERESDRRKSRGYEIWLLENGGDPLSWEKSCRCLMNEVNGVLSAIQEEWSQRCQDEEDRQELRQRYEMEKRTSWEAHEFDQFVTKAAEEAKLDGFDSAVFRKDGGRVERWRKLVTCFDTREAAEEAINRAIHAEIYNLFGRGN